MYCYRTVAPDLYWVGGDDRRLSVFEGVYKVPEGMSYNAYLLMDEKTVLFDTVDRAVADVLYENLDHLLEGRELDYIVVSHMEPDHSATLAQICRRYPAATIVCTQKAAAFMDQFFDDHLSTRTLMVKEGTTLDTGEHSFVFTMAPMVHWPEVMMTFDKSNGILFTADAFGTFGALDGALFADEVDFMRDHLDEARRYYTNIVGKYGQQVQNVLKKAADLPIKMLCPLHGFVWRKDLGDIIGFYDKWSRYEPEEKGVMIAYGSIYGHTAAAARFIACNLRERGVKCALFDTSMCEAAKIVAASFKYSHLVFVSATTNAGIFVRMEEALRDLASHNIQNRDVFLVESGSWAISSGKQMRAILEECKDMRIAEEVITIKSDAKEEQIAQLVGLSSKLADECLSEDK